LRETAQEARSKVIMSEVKTNLRLPDELYESIKRLADRELRSINAQMIVLLTRAVEQASPEQAV
jgi:hypothetical protein